jgi:hypothetical protein
LVDEPPLPPTPTPTPTPVVTPPTPTPTPTPAPGPTPPPPSITDTEKAVRRLAHGFQCAKVETAVKDGILDITGFVASTKDRDQLAKAAGNGNQTWHPRLALEVEPWPHCEARLTLTEPLSKSGGLSVSVKGGPTLKDGESLTLEVVTPDYPTHLYVSYLQADGQVAHLRRYGDAGWKPIPARTRLTLGGAGEWRVSGPVFGRESVVVVASALPLLALDRPAAETERDYLTELRLGLSAQTPRKGQNRVSATLTPLITTP